MLLICGKMILWFLTILAGDILNQWHILSGDRIPSPILGTHPNETLILLDLLHEFGPQTGSGLPQGRREIGEVIVFVYHMLSIFIILCLFPGQCCYWFNIFNLGCFCCDHGMNWGLWIQPEWNTSHKLGCRFVVSPHKRVRYIISIYPLVMTNIAMENHHF